MIISKKCESQYKSWLKILLLFITSAIITGIIMDIFLEVVGISEYGMSNSNDLVGSTYEIVIELISCIGMILTVVIFCNKIDKKSISNIGFINIRYGYKYLIKGLLLGTVSMICVFVILLTTKNTLLQISFSKPNINSSMFTGLIIFIFVGINEELFCRGYCINVLNQTQSKNVAIIGSSIIFSFMHCLNNNMSIISYINLFLFGILAAYMYNKTNNIWMGIGYHITWNYFQGSIFGFKVSGQGVSSMYKVLCYNNIITGGNFGPEGGIVVTFIIILGMLYIKKLNTNNYNNDKDIKIS